MTLVGNTTPYAWPYDGRVEPDITALVLAGSDDAVTASTPLDVAATERIDRLRRELSATGVMVVLVRHAPSRPVATASMLGCAPVVPLAGELMVTAAGWDGFYGSPLDAVLRRHGRTHLLVAGWGFETAVHSTLRRANDRGYECLTVADACVSVDSTLRASSVSSIEMSGGIFGAVGATDDVVAAYGGTTHRFTDQLTAQEEP